MPLHQLYHFLHHVDEYNPAKFQNVNNFLGWRPSHYLLLPSFSGSSSIKHSYNILWVGVSESGRSLPRFIASVYMDDLLLAVYSHEGKRILPRVPWIEMLENEDPTRWQKETKNLWAWDLELRWILANVKNVYNHSQGEKGWEDGCGVRGKGKYGERRTIAPETLPSYDGCSLSQAAHCPHCSPPASPCTDSRCPLKRLTLF